MISPDTVSMQRQLCGLGNLKVDEQNRNHPLSRGERALRVKIQPRSIFLSVPAVDRINETERLSDVE